jgi:Na+-translocating ferredoxin:NAD+ oxidoreductase subunit B
MPFAIADSCTGCGMCARICPTEAIRGEKKAPHGIDEGLCIACGACGRVCPAAAVRDPLGKACVPLKRSAWAKPVLETDRCCSCGICIDACPAGCLAFSTGDHEGGHPYPFLRDAKKCLACGYCARDCPTGALTMLSPRDGRLPPA